MPNPGGISTAPALWLDPVFGVYKDGGVTLAADGETVQQWNDRSGNGRNATQATGGNRPTYKTNIVDGRPVIRFTGASSNFLSLPNFMTGFGAGEIFIRVKINTDPPASGNTGLWEMGTSGSGTGFPWIDGIIYEGFGSNTRKTTVDPVPSLTSWRVYNVSSAAGAWTNRLDGAQLATTGTNTVAFPAAPRLGADAGSAFFLDGDVGEMIFYSTTLASADRTAIAAYMLSHSLSSGTPAQAMLATLEDFI